METLIRCQRRLFMYVCVLQGVISHSRETRDVGVIFRCFAIFLLTTSRISVARDPYAMFEKKKQKLFQVHLMRKRKRTKSDQLLCDQ